MARVGQVKEQDLSGLLAYCYLTALLLAQAAGGAPAGNPAGGDVAGKAAGDAGAGGGLTETIFGTFALPLMAMLLLMYFMLLRPESKKRKEVENTLASLKKNDHVVTIGGICGTVVNISPGSTYITIKVDESNNTRLKILRSAVARVGDTEEPAEAKKEPS
jgi:preprotein translocase subunit YajC